MESHFEKAFLIGFSSLPFKNQKEFVEKQIKKKLFAKYRKGLVDNSPREGEAFSDNLYNPQVYYLWGKYDICAISEVDDFEFATRFFRSYNPMSRDSVGKTIDKEETDSELINFDYKVIMGVSPGEVSKGSFTKPLPYIAISQLKINSAFLIGNGGNLIRKVKEYIEEIIKKYGGKDIVVNAIICESFSYHELIILFTSNSIYTLWKIVLEIRGTKFNSFLRLIKAQRDEARDILNNSLFYDLADLTDKETTDPFEVENHLFESTLTSFGLHFDLFDDTSTITEAVSPPVAGENITFFSKWNIKPGHIAQTNQLLDDLKIGDSVVRHIVTGKGDMLFINKIVIQESASGNQLLDFPEVFFKKNWKLNCKEGKRLPEKHLLSESIIDTFTSINAASAKHENNAYQGFDESISHDHHYDIHDRLTAFTFKPQDILRLIENMKSLWVPKVLSEKVMKLISTYNNAVMNPDMYAFYVELYPYIKNNLLETIYSFYENRTHTNFSGQTLHDILDLACHNIETGLQNRFYQSYWASDLPETNTDYSGGMHNLISAYDSCYKALNNAFRQSVSDSAFIYVKSDSKINSSFDAVKMNFLHLIQPLIYCSVATHESCNYALEKWYLSNLNKHARKQGWEKMSKRIIRLFYVADLDFDTQFVVREEVEKLIPADQKLFGPNAKGNIFLNKTSERLSSNFHLFVNKELLHYHIIGRINYQFAFGGDFNLYNKTAWNYFFQAGHIYNKASSINAKDFFALALRVCLIRFSKDNTPITEEEILSILPKEESVSHLIKIYIKDLYLLVFSLFKTGSPFKVWFDEWEDVLSAEEPGIIPKLGPEYLTIKEAFVDYLENHEARINDKDIYKTIEKYIRDRNDASLVYLALINAYLDRKDEVSVLQRNATDGEPTYTSETMDKVNIDPLGGTFVVGSKNRQHYLAERTKFLRLLHHFSFLYKKRYFVDILSEGQ